MVVQASQRATKLERGRKQEQEGKGAMDSYSLLGGAVEPEKKINVLSLRVELKTSRLLNGCSNQLSYESIARYGFNFYLLIQSNCNKQRTSHISDGRGC